MLNKLRSHIEKVIPLSDADFARIAPFFSVQEAKKNSCIAPEGQRPRYHYFVVQGLMKLVFTDAQGKAHIVGFAMEDWWESDFEAFSSWCINTPRSYKGCPKLNWPPI
mgnify:CR=1 FL=1